MQRSFHKPKRRWARKDISALIAMSNDGHSRNTIADTLGRSPMSIKLKLLEVRNDDFAIAPENGLYDNSPPAPKDPWYYANHEGKYKRARIRLAGRHRYDQMLGNFVDGKPVTVVEMIKLAGLEP